MDGSIKDKRDEIQSSLEDNSEYFKRQCQQYHRDHIGELYIMQQAWKEERKKWFPCDDAVGFVKKYEQLKEIIKEKELQLSQRTQVLNALKRISILHHMLTQLRNDFLSKSSSLHPTSLLLAIKKLEKEHKQLEKDYSGLSIVALYKESINRDIDRCKVVLSNNWSTIFKLEHDKGSSTTKILMNQSWNIDMFDLVRKTGSESIFIPKIFHQWMEVLRNIISYDIMYNSSLTVFRADEPNVMLSQLVTITTNVSSTIKWSKESYLKLFHHLHDIFLIITRHHVLLDDKHLIKSFWKDYELEALSLIQSLLIDDVLSEDLIDTSDSSFQPHGEIIASFSLLQEKIQDHCMSPNDHTHKDLKQYMMERFSDPSFPALQLPRMIQSVLTNTKISRIELTAPDINEYTDLDMSSFMTMLYQNETARFLASEFDSEMLFEFGQQSIESDKITDFYMQFASYKPRCSTQALYLVSLMNRCCRIHDIDYAKIVSSLQECFQVYMNYYQNIDNTWRSMPALSCLLYSDCHFLAHALVMVLMPMFDDEKAINILVQEAEKLISMGNESLEIQNQQQKKFVQECLYEELDLEDLIGLYKEDCRARVDHQLKRIRNHLLNMKKAYGASMEQNTLISRGAYVRSIGQCLNLVLQYIKNALILHISDITEEDTHHFHALTLSVSSWTRELFHMNGPIGGEVVYLREKIDYNGHVVLELDQGMEYLLERQISFLPDWISFQHLSSLLEWRMEDIVYYSMYMKDSVLEPYLLEKNQVHRLIMAIFSPSDMRDEYISMLMNE